MTMSDNAKGFAYVLFAICVWSGWMIASRFAVKGNLNSYDLSAIRFLTAGIVLLPYAIKNGIRIGNKSLFCSLLLSILIGACYTNVTIGGISFAPVSHASSIINGTVLVMTTIAGVYILGEHVGKIRIFGIIITVGGIILMLCANKNSTPDQWIGHLLFVVGGFMWAGYTTLIKKWKVDPFHAVSIVCVISMFTYLPIYLLFATKHISHAGYSEIAFQSFYQGVVTAVIALIAFNKGVEILGASRASALIPLVPVLSTLFAAPILGEIPTNGEILAVTTVSLGVFIASGGLKTFKFMPKFKR